MKGKENSLLWVLLLIVVAIVSSSIVLLFVAFVVLFVLKALNNDEYKEKRRKEEVERKQVAYAAAMAERESEKAILMEKLDSNYWAMKELLHFISDDTHGRKSLVASYVYLLNLRNDLVSLNVRNLSHHAYEIEMSRFNSYFIGDNFVFSINLD
tara:strand:- start:4326 stop:4787 length:462 start_codon:yes stop_codon:yes gene_type:complete